MLEIVQCPSWTTLNLLIIATTLCTKILISYLNLKRTKFYLTKTGSLNEMRMSVARSPPKRRRQRCRWMIFFACSWYFDTCCRPNKYQADVNLNEKDFWKDILWNITVEQWLNWLELIQFYQQYDPEDFEHHWLLLMHRNDI